ncbi:MAG: OmpA family protein [Bacteroidia bacterium]
MKKRVLINHILGFLFLGTSFFVHSQNLISNSGFELWDEEGPIGWEKVALTPDFYNKKIKPERYKEANCGEGFGNSFLGLMQCGEVTSTKLNSPLEKGSDYIIKIFVRRPAQFCPGGIGKITVAFTTSKLPPCGPPGNCYYPVKFIPLYSTNFGVLKEKCKWQEFFGVYTSKGLENYFHVGDFKKVIKKENPISQEDIIVIDSLEGITCTYIHYDSIVVEKISTGKPKILEGLFFENNKSTLLPVSLTELNKLFAYVLKLNSYKIKINGYTDNMGDKTKNKSLSKDRAESVANYLIKKGIPKTRIITNGFGDEKPIDDNSTEKGRAINRRVEMELIK